MRIIKSNNWTNKYKIIKEIIDYWDPIGLLEMHCPPDEYEPEIEQISNLICDFRDYTKNAQIIYEVFTKYFGKDTFEKDMLECEEIAMKLMHLASNKNLLI